LFNGDVAALYQFWNAAAWSETPSRRGRMSASGQTRRFRDVREMSGLPRTADISGPVRHFAFVPISDAPLDVSRATFGYDCQSRL